jgi:hypothetical protein
LSPPDRRSTLQKRSVKQNIILPEGCHLSSLCAQTVNGTQSANNANLRKNKQKCNVSLEISNRGEKRVIHRFEVLSAEAGAFQ